MLSLDFFLGRILLICTGVPNFLSYMATIELLKGETMAWKYCLRLINNLLQKYVQ